MSEPAGTAHTRAESHGRQTLDAVQALRAIAATLVVLYHLASLEAQSGASGVGLLRPFRWFGAQGVDLFFVISGFILCWTNYEAFAGSRTVSRYLVRRFVRIFPLYWLFFAFAIVSARLGLSRALDAAGDPVNLLGIFFLLPFKCVHVVPVSWTLTFEVFFYGVFAVFLRFSRRHLPRLLLTWGVVLVVVNFFFPPPSEPTSMVGRIAYVALGLRSIQFVLGCAIALMWKRVAAHASPRLEWLLGMLGVLGFAAGGARVAVLERAGPLEDLWRPELIVVFGLASAALVAGAVAHERRCGGSFVPRWLVALGDASYSLYLSHLFVFAVLRRVLSPLNGPSMLEHVLWLATFGAAGFAGGLLCYRLIEAPMLRRLGAATTRLGGK